MKIKPLFIISSLLISAGVWADVHQAEGTWNNDLNIAGKNYTCEGKKEVLYHHSMWARGDIETYTFLCVNPSNKKQAPWIMSADNATPSEPLTRVKGKFYQNCQYLDGQGWSCAKQKKISGKISIKEQDLKIGEIYTDNCLAEEKPNKKCKAELAKHDEIGQKALIREKK